MGRRTYYNIFFILISIKIILVTGLRKDVCDRCVKVEDCPMFAHMQKHEQQTWLEKVPCDDTQNNGETSFFGFSSIAKGDHICCPNSNVWGIEPGGGGHQNSVSNGNINNPPKIRPNDNNGPGNFQHPGNQNQLAKPNQNIYGQPQQPGNNFENPQPGPTNPNVFGNQQIPSLYGKPPNPQSRPGGPNMYENHPNGLNNNGVYGNQQNPTSPGIYDNPQNRPGGPNMYVNYPNNPNNHGGYGNQPNPTNPGIYEYPQNKPGGTNIYGNQANPLNPGIYDNPQNRPNIYGNQPNGINNQGVFGNQPNPNVQYPNNGMNTQGNPAYNYPNNQYPNSQNPVQPGLMSPGYMNSYTQRPNYLGQQQPNSYLNNGGNGFYGRNQDQQCRVQTSTPPDPSTGCCGKDMSDSDKITDLQSILNLYAPSNQQRPQNPSPQEYNYQQPNYQPSGSYYPQGMHRRKRSSDNSTSTPHIDLDDRIAGGKETELDQFPWTVLLKVTFDYGDKQASYACGGSLISPKYVLTAGHCIYEKKATIVDIELTLAEYDKSTFPTDCKMVMGEGKQCIENIVMHAEDIIRHPQYDDDRLHNDIALIRLHGYAPYNRFIRSICLPSIDIDSPDFSNLPLAVAGWGRNGPYVTDIKQSTVVHLVPHDECQKSYPHLSRSHLCAAGRTGEDTCKGDSGGPLMMLYRGSYYVIGVVSGKRADSPCGSTVPSLYTNVFQYVQWINSNIRN